MMIMMFFNWSNCVSGGPNHHLFPQKGSCQSVGVVFVLSGSPWHQCWWSLPEVVQHIWRNASLTFSNAPTGPGESYGRFGLLDFCKPFQDVSSFLPAPVGKFKKKNIRFFQRFRMFHRNFLNQLSGDVAFCWVLSFIWCGLVPAFRMGMCLKGPAMDGWNIPIESDQILRLESDSEKSDPKNPLSWKSLLRRHYENLKVFFKKRTPIQWFWGKLFWESNENHPILFNG